MFPSASTCEDPFVRGLVGSKVGGRRHMRGPITRSRWSRPFDLLSEIESVRSQPSGACEACRPDRSNHHRLGLLPGTHAGTIDGGCHARPEPSIEFLVSETVIREQVWGCLCQVPDGGGCPGSVPDSSHVIPCTIASTRAPIRSGRRIRGSSILPPDWPHHPCDRIG